MNQAEAVVCGAGIAGIAAAYYLSRGGLKNVVLLEQADPLALTSDKSTEAYRNWWPGPYQQAGSEAGRRYVGAMTALINRSLELLEGLAAQSTGRIRLTQRGYLYASASSQGLETFARAALDAQRMGAGALRIHDQPSRTYQSGDGWGLDGADLLTHPGLIRQHFPFLNPQTQAVLHVRRAGWFTAQQFGMYLLEQARTNGVRLLRARLVGVETVGGRVAEVVVEQAGTTTRLQTPILVNAAGPMQAEVAALLGQGIPVLGEAHFKMSFADSLGAIPRTSPMLIWADPLELPWSPEERELLAQEPESRWMTQTLPGGVHGRPDGYWGEVDSQQFFLLYNPHHTAQQPRFPIHSPPYYADLALRALAVMVPAVQAYVGRVSKPYLDGGYYMRTPENRPLIGPLGVDGAYILGALGGFGLMAACGAGELLSQHILGLPLPDYAPAFTLERYRDPVYTELLQHWGDGAQL